VSTLPHTWTDDADNTLTITARPGPRLVTRTTIPTEDDQDVIEHVASVTAPKGADAVEMASAVLAAAGDTGHEVARTDEIDAYRARSARGFELTCEVRRLRQERDAAFEKGARSMRDLAAQEVLIDTHRVPMAISEAIAALPLLPDDPARTPLTADTDALCADQCPRGHAHSCARSPKHYGPHRDVKQKGTENCSWAGDHPL